MNIDLVLSRSAGQAMYLQIIEQVNQRIAVGDWPRGAKLPSIRELAVALKISVITVKRAYLELEHAGTIVTQQGKGSWVSERVVLTDLKRKALDRQLREAARLGSSMGMSSNDLAELLSKYTDK